MRLYVLKEIDENGYTYYKYCECLEKLQELRDISIKWQQKFKYKENKFEIEDISPILTSQDIQNLINGFKIDMKNYTQE